MQSSDGSAMEERPLSATERQPPFKLLLALAAGGMAETGYLTVVSQGCNK